MMRFRILSVATLCAAIAIAAPASAAPIGASALQGATTNIDRTASQIHYRRHRHCHRHHGDRFCHGRRHYRHGGYGWSGVGIYIGKRHHHHRHHRHHRRHRRHH